MIGQHVTVTNVQTLLHQKLIKFFDKSNLITSNSSPRQCGSIKISITLCPYSTMDPQQFANTIERYIERLVEGEQQDNIFVELQNATQNPQVHVQTGVDEVDLVDGQSH